MLRSVCSVCSKGTLAKSFLQRYLGRRHRWYGGRRRIGGVASPYTAQQMAGSVDDLTRDLRAFGKYIVGERYETSNPVFLVGIGVLPDLCRLTLLVRVDRVCDRAQLVDRIWEGDSLPTPGGNWYCDEFSSRLRVPTQNRWCSSRRRKWRAMPQWIAGPTTSQATPRPAARTWAAVQPC